MKRFSLNFKIGFIVAILMIAAGVIAWVGVWQSRQVGDSLDRVVETLVPRVESANQIMSTYQRLILIEKNLALADSPETLKEALAEGEQFQDEFEKELDEASKIASSKCLVILHDVSAIYGRWKEMFLDIRRAKEAGDEERATSITKDLGRQLRREMDAKTKDLLDIQRKEMQEENAKSSEARRDGDLMMIAIIIVAFLTSLVLAVVIMRNVSRSIDRVVGQLNDSANQVNAAAKQIASTSEVLSQATTEQAASLEETAASVEQMSAMIKRNSENADHAARTSTSSEQSAQRGKAVVERMVQSVDDIASANDQIMKQIEESNQRISDIVKVIGEIGNRTKIINDIVFQTKLLSFNASVEAARAGEHGKGFAVVAEEVGKLAQMSGSAAKEIASMLEDSIRKVEGIVDDTKSRVEGLINMGRSKVAVGTEVARECGQVLDKIVEDVGGVVRMAGEIATASGEQTQGISEISRAMGQLDQVTQQNAASSQESASASEELSAQAEFLKSVVTTLVLTIKGDRGDVTAASEGPAETMATPPREQPNVIALKSHAAKPKTGAVASRTKSAGTEFTTRAEQKAVVGLDGVPSASDPRFDD